MTGTETLSRRRHFAQVPDSLVIDKRLSHVAVRVWVKLDKYAGANGEAFPSRQRLADDIGCSVASIKRALSELTDTGWITRTRRSTMANIWDTVINDAPETAQPSDGTAGQDGRVTSEPSGRVTDGPSGGSHMTRLEKETQQKDTQVEGNDLSRVAAARDVTKGRTRSDWRGDDRRLWADTIGGVSITSDGSGPWKEGTFTPDAVYEALRRGNHLIKAKRWPGQFLQTMGDWEDYLSGLGLEVNYAQKRRA